LRASTFFCDSERPFRLFDNCCFEDKALASTSDSEEEEVATTVVVTVFRMVWLEPCPGGEYGGWSDEFDGAELVVGEQSVELQSLMLLAV